MEPQGIIFDIKHFAVHDGPGIRTTVFFKGCPMECWWCHNPEGLSTEEEVFYYEAKCMGCHRCIDICSASAIDKNNDGIGIIRENCNTCGECVEECPTGALQIAGNRVTVDEVMDEIKKSIIYFNKSGGGVTFSGGEPLMQPDFLRGLIIECRDRGIHIALDTSGYAPREIFDSMVDDIDIFLYDLKLISDSRHKKYTAVSNKVILENLGRLSEKDRGRDVFIRFPVVPNITDGDRELDEIIEFISSLKDINKVNLLPFHNVREKYERLGRKYRIKNVKSPDRERVKHIKELFQEKGFKVKIGG